MSVIEKARRMLNGLETEDREEIEKLAKLIVSGEEVDENHILDACKNQEGFDFLEETTAKLKKIRDLVELSNTTARRRKEHGETCREFSKFKEDRKRIEKDLKEKDVQLGRAKIVSFDRLSRAMGARNKLLDLIGEELAEKIKAARQELFLAERSEKESIEALDSDSLEKNEPSLVMKRIKSRIKVIAKARLDNRDPLYLRDEEIGLLKEEARYKGKTHEQIIKLAKKRCKDAKSRLGLARKALRELWLEINVK